VKTGIWMLLSLTSLLWAKINRVGNIACPVY